VARRFGQRPQGGEGPGIADVAEALRGGGGHGGVGRFHERHKQRNGGRIATAAKRGDDARLERSPCLCERFTQRGGRQGIRDGLERLPRGVGERLLATGERVGQHRHLRRSAGEPQLQAGPLPRVGRRRLGRNDRRKPGRMGRAGIGRSHARDLLLLDGQQRPDISPRLPGRRRLPFGGQIRGAGRRGKQQRKTHKHRHPQQAPGGSRWDDASQTFVML
jgi:hypothetical protein